MNKIVYFERTSQNIRVPFQPRRQSQGVMEVPDFLAEEATSHPSITQYFNHGSSRGNTCGPRAATPRCHPRPRPLRHPHPRSQVTNTRRRRKTKKDKKSKKEKKSKKHKKHKHGEKDKKKHKESPSFVTCTSASQGDSHGHGNTEFG